MAEAKIIGVLDLTEARKAYDEFIRHVSGVVRVGIPTGIAPTGTVSGGGGLSGGIAGTSTYTVPNLIGTSSGVSGGQVGGISGVPGGASGEMGNAAKELADAVRSAAAQIRATIGGGGGNVGIGASRGGASTAFRGGLSLSDITAERAGRLDALRNAYTPFVDSPEKDAYHAERRFQAETSPSRELSQRVSEYRAGVRQADRIGNLEGRAELARAVTPEFRREILSARRDATEEGTEEYARADLDLAREESRGRKTGGTEKKEPRGYLDRAVARFAAPYFAFRAVANASRTAQQYREAEFREGQATDIQEYYSAQTEKIRAVQESYVGRGVDIIFGLGGFIESPTERKMKAVERASARSRFTRTRIANEGQAYVADQARSAFLSGGTTAEGLSRANAEDRVRIVGYEQSIVDLESMNWRMESAVGSGQVGKLTTDQFENYKRNRDLIAQNRGLIGGIRSGMDTRNETADEERRLKARTIGNAAAESQDFIGGLDERSVARNALIRSGVLSVQEQNRSDPRLSPLTAIRNVFAQTEQEARFGRQDELNSIRNRGGSRAAGFRAANDPFAASVAAMETENAAELYALRRQGAPTGEAEQRQRDDARAMTSEMQRGLVTQRMGLQGQSDVLAASLLRDPLGSTLAGIESDTALQSRAAQSLPRGRERDNILAAIDQVGGQRVALATQQFADERLSSRAALEFQNESLGILGQSYAEGGGSYSSRVRRAESNTTLRRTQLDSLRAAQSGQSYLIPGIEEGGRRTLTAQRERYLAAFTAQEGGSGVIGGTSSAQAVLDEISAKSAAIGNAKAGGLDGTGKAITVDDLERIVNQAVKDVTTVQ